MRIIIWFILDFLLVFSIYYFIFIRKAIRNKKSPSEATLLINYFKLDINKFNYRKFIFNMSIVSSLDIALIATITTLLINKVIYQIVIGFFICIPIIFLSYYLFGKYYQKKQLKDNHKEIEKEKKYNERRGKKHV